MATQKIRVTGYLEPETYQQLHQYMTELKLSQTKAISAIVSSYLAGKAQDELTARIDRLEREISDLKRHVVAVRFR